LLRVFRYSKVGEMKICMISYSVYKFDNRVHRYGESLVSAGHHLDVICLGRAGRTGKDKYQKTNLYQIQYRTFDEKGPISYLTRILRFLVKSFYMITWLHLRHRYDVIHYHNIPDFGVFCTLIPKFLGAKIILDIHDLVPEFYSRKFNLNDDHPMVKLLKWVERISCRYADHVIISNHIWWDWITNRSVRKDKCSVILNAPYPPLFNPYREKVKKRNLKRFVILYHGALNEHFGVDIAIKAVDSARRKVPSILLNIYGTGREDENLKRMTEKFDLSKHVHFYDPLPRDKVPELIRDADIGIVPKRSARFADSALSSKLLEFAYMKKPVIVSRTRASQRYFTNEMVRFFEPEDTDKVCQNIVDLAKHRRERESLSMNVDKFNLVHNWGVYQKVYFSILNRLNGIH